MDTPKDAEQLGSELGKEKTNPRAPRLISFDTDLGFQFSYRYSLGSSPPLRLIAA